MQKGQVCFITDISPLKNNFKLTHYRLFPNLAVRERHPLKCPDKTYWETLSENPFLFV